MTAQVFIALFGVTAVALSQSALADRRRLASVFGLLGQPFWFYAAWEAQQWGIFALCEDGTEYSKKKARNLIREAAQGIKQGGQHVGNVD